MAHASCSDTFAAALGLAWTSVGAGRGVLRLLREHGAVEVWRAHRRSLEDWGIAPRVAAGLDASRGAFSLESAQKAVVAAGLRFVAFGTPEYPPEFTHLALPPAGFFVRGSGEVLEKVLTMPRMTVVGTRRATSYGLRAAEAFAAAFADAGVVVVSGLALGIDTRAHKTAVSVGGVSVAILGCGADLAYPRVNRWLYDRISETGLVLSELPPGVGPARWTFPHRNRLLAALGDAVLVVEASCTSGALQTAGAALELGRPVFAVPGSIFCDGYSGCNRLLHDGAGPAIQPCATVEDFLSQTRIERGDRRAAGDHRPAEKSTRQLSLMQAMTSRQVMVWEALASGPCSVDLLVERVGLTARELMAALSELELAGVVERVNSGAYARAP